MSWNLNSLWGFIRSLCTHIRKGKERTIKDLILIKSKILTDNLVFLYHCCMNWQKTDRDEQGNRLLLKEFRFIYIYISICLVFIYVIIHCKCVNIFAFQDYKTYLDFVLALENKKEPQALRYLFRILDVQHKGYLNVFALNYFFRVSAFNNYVTPTPVGWVLLFYISFSLLLFFHTFLSARFLGDA